MSNVSDPHAWGSNEKSKWLAAQRHHRSYQQLVVEQIPQQHGLELVQYGSLSYDKDYPLLLIKSKHWDTNRPTALITGGVHGYETSGVFGCLKFLEDSANNYLERLNLIIAPCISPWGFETINRWNPDCVDPNRSFSESGESLEAKYLNDVIAAFTEIDLHIDLHETTDSDETTFRPALAARDGKPYIPGTVPDGFYLVGDSEQPQPEFQAYIINAVRKVTHIAPADNDGTIIGSKVVQPGVINYPCRSLGLCAGLTNATYKTTTEVYPDSPKSNDENCNLAQHQAICAALDFLIKEKGL